MGQNLIIESTAISVIAWMNEQSRYSSRIIPAVNWIVSKVSAGGSYGSTQATILSLKAITLYMKNFTEINGDGNFVLRLNNQKVQTIKFNSTYREAIQFDFDFIKKNYPNLLSKG
jgi:alpha-2-macroglobulin-like protein